MGLTRRKSLDFGHPNMSELRIVLLGKDALANNRVRNSILGINENEAPSADVEQCTESVKRQPVDRLINVINDPHLLQPDLYHIQIAKRVKECVYLSDPGPHTIILVLQHNDFSEDNIRRVNYVLKQFSDKAIKHTIVLTTDTETLSSSLTSVQKNNAMHQLIKECGGGHIQFDQRQSGCYSEIIQRVEKIKDEYEEFLKCEVFDDAEEGISASVVRVEEEEEGYKKKNDGGGFLQFFSSASGKAKLNFVLCGRNTKLKASVFDMLQGKTSSTHQRESSLVCVKTEMKVHGRHITVVELPALTELSEEEVMCQTLRCVSLCDGEVHIFLLIIPVGPLTDEDKTELEKIQKIFYYKKHFVVLFTTDLAVDQSVRNSVTTAESQRVVNLYGGHYNVMGLKDHRNFEQISDLLECIESIKTEPYSLQMYIKAQEKRVRHELEEQLSEMKIKIKELEKKVQQEGEDAPSDSGFLRIVLIGKTGNGKSETGNTILGREEFHTEVSLDSVTTVCMKGIGEVQGRSVAVVDTPGLFDTTLSNEKVQEEVVKCVSLSAPGPHVFIIVLSVGKFTNEEKNTVDLIKMIFGPSAAQFSIVLFTRGDDLKNETIEKYVEKSKNADLKKLIRDCRNRFLVFNNRDKKDNTQITWLLNMIEEVKKSNKGQYFTNSMFEEAEMSIKKKVEEILKEKEREVQAKYDMEMETMMERLDKEKRKADEEKMKMVNQFKEKEETLRKEFEEKEKAEQKRREEVDKKRSDEEKQQKAEYHQKIEEMQKEIENQRLLYEKQQKEKEEQDKNREEKYKQDQEKLKDEQKRVMAELKKKQKEETKRRLLEEQRRIWEEEDERQRWERRIKEHEHDKKEIQENLKQQQKEWEEETKKQMREREEEERKRKERHDEQLREKQEELEKMRKKSEREREEERQKIEEERQRWKDSERRVREQKERELEEKKNELQKHYEQLARERKEDWERSKREDDERREEERKRWRKMIEDLKREQEVEISRREKEEKDRKEKEEKERNQMKKEYEKEIKEIKREHEDEARKQAEEFNEFRENKDRHIQELTEKLKHSRKDYEDLERVFESLLKLKSEETKELRKEIERLKIRKKCYVQ